MVRGRLSPVIVGTLVIAAIGGCGGRKSAVPGGKAEPPPGSPAARPATWLEIRPRNPEIKPGGKVTLALRGFDSQDFEVQVRPRWSA